MAITQSNTGFRLTRKKREDLAWAAGFWDGEGCMTLAKSKRIAPFGIVPQTESNKAILERFARAIAPIECSIHGPVQNRVNGRPVGRPVYRLRIIRFESVQALGAMLWKWWGTAKREQFRRVMLAWASQPPRKLKIFNTALLSDIYRRGHEGESQRSIARALKMPLSHVQKILSGELHARYHKKFHVAEAKRCGARLWPSSLVGSTPTRHPTSQMRLWQ